MLTPSHEAASRRTFAIMSHPDAGKTTLTERLLQLAGAVGQAGRVKARPGKRAATSDWMEIERARGISVSSTVLRFKRNGVIFNLLDTPGHHDFSEDTYRVLSAADAAVMLIDAAKGAEEQTLKLFEVARQRELPIITFVNKIDRPGLSPLELLADIEQATRMEPTPVTWPLGPIGMIDGIVDRRSGAVTLAERTGAAGLVHALHGQLDGVGGLATWPDTTEELALLDAIEAHVERGSFLAGTSTPVFFGCALTGFGVNHLLDAAVELVPSPSNRLDVRGQPRPLDSSFSAFVFKVQANLDPRHRDRIAFLRVCSGDGDPVTFPRLPVLVPQVFAHAHNTDISRYKQFQGGLKLLEEEGVVYVLLSPKHGYQQPVLAGAGPMQFDVAVHRLQNEFGASIALERLPYRHARATTANAETVLRAARGIDVLTRSDGVRIAVFESDYHLREFTRHHPEIELTTVL